MRKTHWCLDYGLDSICRAGQFSTERERGSIHSRQIELSVWQRVSVTSDLKRPFDVRYRNGKFGPEAVVAVPDGFGHCCLPLVG